MKYKIILALGVRCDDLHLISLTNQKPPILLSPTSSSLSSSSLLVVSMSLACSKQCIIAAMNILEGKSQVASEILMRLARFSNPKGNSEERLMSYWVSALKSINVSLWIWVLDLWIYAIRDLV